MSGWVCLRDLVSATGSGQVSSSTQAGRATILPSPANILASACAEQQGVEMQLICSLAAGRAVS